ncbi:MAG: galactokinase [Ruminococcaceae bacterium]|jgi:galactokinase|nr:galactokinase [Oscillospiraceae bacterium]
MTAAELKKTILEGGIDAALTDGLSVSPDAVPAQRERYAKAADAFLAKYGDGDVSLYSVGGRSEISGNHTDHNHGRVIAASVNLDILAVAKPTDDGRIRIQSEGFPEDVVDASMADAPDEANFFTSAAIIAGMEKAFLNAGYKVGGFDAYTTSNVLKGSGISSSAAFEVMVGNILNYLYNDGKVSNVEIAKMSQYAENVYFGKPCGLMDQTACAVGGFITIDFADPTQPVIEKLGFDLTAAGYRLCIVNTGGNHANLNADYASVPAEMKAVAKELGVSVLRESSKEALDELLARHGKYLRTYLGDRAILRAYHFFAENERVAAQVDALRAGDIEGFKAGVTASGNSSFKFLQNVYTTINVEEQGLSLALCLTEDFLRGTGGVCRVHGGGFAGTIQAFVPADLTAAYREKMDAVFGAGACHILSVRKNGACRIL